MLFFKFLNHPKFDINFSIDYKRILDTIGCRTHYSKDDFVLPVFEKYKHKIIDDKIFLI